MPGIPYRYAEAFSRLKRATEQLHAQIESGEFYSYGYLTRRKLLRRVRRLYNRLAGPISPAALGAALAAAGVLTLAGCRPPETAYIPAFAPAAQNPFGLGFTDSYQRLDRTFALADFDGDGDPDLLTGVYSEGVAPYAATNVALSENGGTAAVPAFGSLQGLVADPNNESDLRIKGLGSSPRPTVLAAADIDDDGDTDLLLSNRTYVYDPYYYSYSSTIQLLFVENEGTPEWPLLLNAVEIDSSKYVSFRAAAVVDADGDGDLDIIAINEENTVIGFRTDVSGSTVTFSDWTPEASVVPDFSSVFPDPTTELLGLAITDLDGDGDLDVVVTGTTGSYSAQEAFIDAFINDGGAPASFARPDPPITGLVVPDEDWQPYTYGQHPYVAAADIDDDGDMDLLIGPSYSYNYDPPYGWVSVFHFLENTADPLAE